ncbi:PEGA domain-containing protein [bacterium]|nr:PEGA domain-containing protein [bacterium]
MRALKIFFLVLVLCAGFGLFDQYAEAQKAVAHPSGGSHGGSHGSYHGGSHGGYHGGYHGYHGGYRYRYYSPYYYRPYLGFYGYGWGYPYYGYGFGYPAYSGYYYGYGEVKLEVKPKDAQVFLDGDYVGTVDEFNSWYQRMNVEPGKHRIVIREQGYQPYRMDLRVLPGQSYKIKEQMHPGNDVIPDNEMRLPESEYRDQDRYQDRYQDQGRYQNQERDREYNRGYAPPDQDYRPEDRDQYNRNIEPYGSDGQQEGYQQNSAGKTMMTFQVEPRDATIYIDGNYYGTADGQNNNEIQVLLADGTHRLEVVRPGYASFSKDILVNNTATHSITIQLEKK